MNLQQKLFLSYLIVIFFMGLAVILGAIGSRLVKWCKIPKSNECIMTKFTLKLCLIIQICQYNYSLGSAALV